MARRALPDSDHVPIGLTVSETDVAQIDEVLARPEFAGWSRSQWCREIIRTALRYYMRGPSADAAAQPAPASERPAPAAASARAPAAGTSSPAGERAAAAAGSPDPGPGEAPLGGGDVPEQPARPECPHPADARDYERGVCAACGTVIWD